MPGKPWTTQEQSDFLTKYLPQYFEMQANRTLSSIFWPLLDREWFRAYPEKVVMFPGCEELTAEQEEKMKAALDERRKVSNMMHHNASQRWD